jgi:predicted O-linked N-acetylglucosamine transferase (SPINDLY family)
MGVPVVTLLGRVHAGRVGASLLRQIGCPHLIATTPDEYVQVAIKLASDRDGLTAGRTALRARMAASALTDSTLITRDLENAYRAIWRRYCGVA